MTKVLRPGTAVSWRWGAHAAHGTVEQAFTRPVSRTLKGKRIRRKASAGTPAYLIRQADGAGVLKSHSELEEQS